MNSCVACMTDVEVVELERNYPPFKRGSHWAEPLIRRLRIYAVCMKTEIFLGSW